MKGMKQQIDFQFYSQTIPVYKRQNKPTTLSPTYTYDSALTLTSAEKGMTTSAKQSLKLIHYLKIPFNKWPIGTSNSDIWVISIPIKQ